MERSIFEIAVRGKFRFEFRGYISTEDLFDLSVEELDSIFKKLNSQIKQVKEESLLGVKTKADKELEVKIEIVKYIVADKLEERAKALEAKEKRLQKAKILEILAEKQDESLQGKTEEELQQMLKDLD